MGSLTRHAAPRRRYERLDEDGDPLVTTDEAKTWLRLLTSSEDDIVDACVQRATKKAEVAFGRALREGQHRATFDPGPADTYEIELPYPPFQSLDEVEEWDPDTDAWVARDVADFVVRSATPLGVIAPKKGKTFVSNPTRITWTAGYDPAEVPEDLKGAILELTAWYFEHRGEEPDEAGAQGTTGKPPNVKLRYPSLVVMHL